MAGILDLFLGWASLGRMGAQDRLYLSDSVPMVPTLLLVGCADERGEAAVIGPFPLWRDGWLKRTIGMGIEARGVYLEVVLALWVTELPIPMDELRHLARVSDRRTWVRAWREIEPRLEKTADGGYLDPWVESCRQSPTAAAQLSAAAADADLAERMAALGRRSAANRRERFGTAQPGTVRKLSERETVEREWEVLKRAASNEPERAASNEPSEPEEAWSVQSSVPKTVPNPIGSRTEDQSSTEQSLRDDVPTSYRSDDTITPPHAVLVKLVHTILDELDAKVLTIESPTGLTEEVKTRAARYHLPYDSRSVEAALEAADWQRPRQTPLQCAVRLLYELVRLTGNRGLTAEEARKALYEAVQARYPTEVFAEWRDATIRLGWEESTWRAVPTLLAFDGKRLTAVPR